MHAHMGHSNFANVGRFIRVVPKDVVINFSRNSKKIQDSFSCIVFIPLIMIANAKV